MWSRHLNAAEARAIADELGLDGILLPKQDLFVKATEREVLYSGAFAAGKTRCLCLKAVMRASHPGTREGLCRKHLVSLKATTLKTLLEPDGHLPAMLPKGTYTHHKSDKIIKLNLSDQQKADLVRALRRWPHADSQPGELLCAQRLDD